jgi:hypothetical protein
MLSIEPANVTDCLLFSDNREEVAYGIYLLRRAEAKDYTPERIARLKEIASRQDSFYDAYLINLVSDKFYPWEEYGFLNPIISALLRSSQKEGILRAIFHSETNTKKFIPLILSANIDARDIRHSETRAKYLDLLYSERKIGSQELADGFHKVFSEQEFESQKFIIRSLLKHKLLYAEQADWIWAYFQNTYSQLYALWIYEYGSSRSGNSDRITQASRRSEIARAVLEGANRLLTDLPADDLVRLMDFVTFEQSMKRMDWYIELLQQSYRRNPNPNLARFLRKTEAIEHRGIIFKRFRQTREAIDAYYDSGLDRDVLTASERAIVSLKDPNIRILMVDFMVVVEGDNFFEGLEDQVRREVWKSGGLSFPLGQMRSEVRKSNGDIELQMLGVTVGIRKSNGEVVNLIDRDKGYRILDNLAKQIAVRAGIYDTAESLPQVVDSVMGSNAKVVSALEQEADNLASIMESLNEDENFVQNVHDAVLEIVKRVGGEDFPIANNYREQDYVEYYHDRTLPNVKEKVSIGTVLGVPVSYHTRDDSTQRRNFQPRQTKTIARAILLNLTIIFQERSQKRGIFMNEWSYRKPFLKTIVETEKSPMSPPFHSNSSQADTEDHAQEGGVSREDAEAIEKLADSSGARRIALPVDIVQELEKKFGPGRVGPVEVVVVAQPFMHTISGRPINGPVRIGNRIFAGDEYFAGHNNDLRSILVELGHEAMAQWVAEMSPELTAEDAHGLASQMQDIFRIEGKSNSPANPQSSKNTSGSSSLPNSDSIPDTKGRFGGIDFRSLPIVTQAVGNLNANISSSSINRLSNLNLNSEWREIENLVNSGITPSAERIKEYVQASCYRGSVDRDIDKVISCISDILRLEEEHYSPTEPTLKDILVVLDSANSVQQLRAIFIGTTP